MEGKFQLYPIIILCASIFNIHRRDTRDPGIAPATDTSSGSHNQLDLDLRAGMDFYNSSVIKIYRSFLLYCGMWPYDDSVARLIQRVLCSLNMLIFLLLQILKALNSETMSDMLIDLAPIMFMELSIIVKFHLYWIKHKYFKESFEHMKTDWSRLEATEITPLKQAYKDCISYSKFLFFFTYAPILLLSVFLFLPKFIDIDVPSNESRFNSLIVPIEYFVDQNKYFYLIASHMCLSALMISSIQCASDILYWIMLMHMMGMFRLLGYLMEHLFDKPGDTDDKIDLNTIYYKRLVRIMDLHECNLKLGEIYMRCIYEAGVILIILSIFSITSILLKLKQIVSPLENVPLVISHCALSGCYISILYLSLLMLQKVDNASSDMFVNIYCGAWYMAPIKSQKLLLIPMQRYMKPYRAQIKSLLTVNMEAFATMLRAGFSYFMALYSLQD